MREKITTALEVFGAGTVACGAGMMYRPAGVMVAGVFCILGGYLVAR